MQIARLQQLTTALILLTAGGWAAVALKLGAPGWAAAGALLLVFGYAVFLAAEFVMLACVHGDDPAPRASAGQLLRAWWGEVYSAPRVFCWNQPFRSQRWPDQLEAASGRRGLVLVHGFLCNRGFWNPWLPRLRAQGVPHVAVSLEPAFGSIDDYPRQIEHAVRQVEAATGLPPVIVGHSMGGLAVRAWLAGVEDRARVHRVITIGSPHHGTWLARFAWSVNGAQMSRQASAWRQALEARESAVASEPFGRFTCFYSNADNIAFPPSTGALPGADNRHVPGVAHVHLATQKVVLNEVVAWLAPDSSGSSSPERAARRASA